MPEALRVKLHAVYKQATQGDCKEPKPFDRRQRERWEEWCKFEGTPPDVAKRRFITLLRTVDPALVTIVVPEEPPPGFPTTAFGDKICARCNSAIGCCQPLLAADGAPLTKKLLADEDLLTYERLKEFVVKASDNRRCKWGRHVPIPANMARQFKRWYESAGIGGFEPYIAEKDKTFENVLRVLLGTQFQKLHEMQLIAADLTYGARCLPWRCCCGVNLARCVICPHLPDRGAHASCFAFVVRRVHSLLHLKVRGDRRTGRPMRSSPAVLQGVHEARVYVRGARFRARNITKI